MAPSDLGRVRPAPKILDLSFRGKSWLPLIVCPARLILLKLHRNGTSLSPLDAIPVLLAYRNL